MPESNPDLTRYINSALSKKIYHPSLSLCACIDAIFTSDEDPDNDKWWEFEYETVLQTIERLGYVKPNTNILGQIQCIAAIRNNKSFIDKEWNQFEKAVAALTGIPVLFYEKQNLPIENVLLAMRIMPQLGEIEYSDEVKHYIGCEAINDDIFWYPIKEVDDYLYQALDRIKNTLGFKIEEIEDIRDKVKNKFSKLKKEEIENITFDEENMSDQMCKRIMKSIYTYHDLMKKENEELTLFNGIKEGKVPFDSKDASRAVDPGEDYSDVETGDEYNITLDNTGEVTHYEDGINPDDPAEVEIFDFNDGVKEASMELMGQAAFNFVNPIEDLYHGQSIKIAHFAMGGLEALPNIIGLMEKMAAIPHPFGSSAASAMPAVYEKSKTLELREPRPGLHELGITDGDEVDEFTKMDEEEPDSSGTKYELKTTEASLKTAETNSEEGFKPHPAARGMFEKSASADVDDSSLMIIPTAEVIDYDPFSAD